ncbi:hypothetical protein Pfo_003645, partial [Paulownia fortunei]
CGSEHFYTLTEKRENNSDRNDELHELRERSLSRIKKRSFSSELKREKTVGRSPSSRSTRMAKD